MLNQGKKKTKKTGGALSAAGGQISQLSE